MPPCFSAALATLWSASKDKTAAASARTLRMVFLPRCFGLIAGHLMNVSMAGHRRNRQGLLPILVLRTIANGLRSYDAHPPGSYKKATRRLRRVAGSLAAGLCRSSRRSAIDFKQAGAALAAADAHRHDAPLRLAPAAFLQDMAGETRTGHAEGMADRDRAAVDVVLLRIDAELVARIEALAGESLIELPEIDVVDLQTMALQQLRH